MPVMARRILVLLAGLAWAAALPARAEEKKDGPSYAKPNFKYKTVTTPEGLTFRTPEDMPIETRDGILAPIPFDEYVYGKFSQLYARLDRLESKLDTIENLLTQIAAAAPSAKAKPPASESQEQDKSAVLIR